MDTPLHKVGQSLILVCPHSLTPATAANWIYLGGLDGATVVRPTINKSRGHNDVVGNIGIAGSTYAMAGAPEVQCQLIDETKAKLAAILNALAVTSGGGNAIGLKAGLVKVSELFMAIIPSDEVSLGVAAPNAIWLPGADLQDFGSFTRQMPEAGKNTRPRATTFVGTYVDKFPPNGGGSAMPAGSQIMVIGDITQFGAPLNTITLPSLTQYVPAQS